MREARTRAGAGAGGRGRARRRDGVFAPRAWLLGGAFLVLLGMGACSPFYVARAGWEQAKILASRESLVDVMTNPETDAETRGKLRLVRDARTFAVEELGFQDVGDSYTSVAFLEADTLALVLSAAHQDRLAFRTWWFPIVGRVPYRAYFSERSAREAKEALQEEGFDTHLRSTAAFSTLGWFSDPLYSTILRRDHVGVVETVLHELAHQHLFIPGQGRFNESFATFVGNVAAKEFFCRRDGGGPDTVWCHRARDRWLDAQDVSRHLDGLEREIRDLYARYHDGELQRDELLEERDRIYARGQERFRDEVQPGLRASTFGVLAQEPFNNATFLARILYYHRLPDFQRLLETHDGDLPAALAHLRSEAPGTDDPFDLLPDGNETVAGTSGGTWGELVPWEAGTMFQCSPGGAAPCSAGTDPTTAKPTN